MTVSGCERKQAKAEDVGEKSTSAITAVGSLGAAPQALELRLMTFNLRYENPEETGYKAWANRVVPVVRRITQETPDVLAVQEALHGQVADLWASLNRYTFMGCGRDDGRHEGEFTGVFYRKDRFRHLSKVGGAFWLSDTPEVPGSKTWGNTHSRMALHLRLQEIETGRQFDVFTTHWDHRNQSARERSAKLMTQRIRDVFTPGIPVVLLGDFNAVETNPALKWLKSSGHPEWIDTYQTLHPNEMSRTTLHFWRATRLGRLKVDHILVSAPATPIAARIVDQDRPAISDHFPVTARVRFP